MTKFAISARFEPALISLPEASQATLRAFFEEFSSRLALERGANPEEHHVATQVSRKIFGLGEQLAERSLLSDIVVSGLVLAMAFCLEDQSLTDLPSLDIEDVDRVDDLHRTLSLVPGDPLYRPIGPKEPVHLIATALVLRALIDADPYKIPAHIGLKGSSAGKVDAAANVLQAIKKHLDLLDVPGDAEDAIQFLLEGGQAQKAAA